MFEFGGMKNLRIYRAKNIESSLNRLHLAVQSRNLRITLLSFLYIISGIKNFIDPWSHADEKLVIKIFSPVSEFSFPNFRREIINNLVSLIKNNTERKFHFVSTFAKIRGMWFVFFFFIEKHEQKKRIISTDFSRQIWRGYSSSFRISTSFKNIRVYTRMKIWTVRDSTGSPDSDWILTMQRSIQGI